MLWLLPAKVWFGGVKNLELSFGFEGEPLGRALPCCSLCVVGNDQLQAGGEISSVFPERKAWPKVQGKLLRSKHQY